jgi:hypothetical protein
VIDPQRVYRPKELADETRLPRGLIYESGRDGSRRRIGAVLGR